jgi:hypothetical protein
MEGSVIKRFAASVCVVATLLLSWVSPALGQGGSNSSISGTVVDSGGGAIPGAAVVARNESGAVFETVTNSEGVFNIPAVSAGSYRVTITLTGFKTTVVDVRVLPNTPTSVKAVLEVGQLQETVTVMSSSELINTQTATVASTLNADQLNRMPTPTRNALNAVTFLPGVNTATTNRESRINGLPESFIQITMDGVNNNDNFLRTTDSFFASVTPRQDAVEAVSVVTAVGGATVGGSGAVSINFTTRSGTNRFTGTAYNYLRHPDMNTNYYFNDYREPKLPKNDIKLYQFGARSGGPIVIPGMFDGRGKAFYMIHYEQLRFPNSFTRSRNVLHPRALDGWFRYTASGQTREVNVLDLARANNQAAATDPTVISLLRNIASATQADGFSGRVLETSDPLVNTYEWLSPGRLFEHQPTLRIDYNLGDNHRLSGSYAILWAERDPDYLNNADVRFPGAPNYRFFNSRRPLTSISLRSTVSRDMVNEFRMGITAKGGASYFGADFSNGPGTFADQGGYAIDFDSAIGLTNWFTSNAPSWRSAPTYSLENSLTWQKGTHSITVGTSWLSSRVDSNSQQMVPGINLRFDTTRDPAAGMFVGGNAATATFPGASNAQLDDARALYALLTGRVGSITGEATLDGETNRYTPFAPLSQRGKIDLYSGYIQDNWRWTPTLTVTAGLRYDVQTPFAASNDILTSVSMASACGMSGIGGGGVYDRCNFFVQGAQPNAVVPQYDQLTGGTLGYETDLNNFAPSAQLAWRPNVQGGFMRTLLGDPEQATLRGGYSVAYERQGSAEFLDVFGSNPGSFISLTNDADAGFGSDGWPVFLNQTSRLQPRPFQETPSYPIPIQSGRGSDLFAFAPEIKIGQAHTWMIGFQRSISRDMAVEVRYVGTYGRDQWSTLDYNSIRGENLIQNGFMNEFKLAMQNLAANNAAGGSRAGSIAYFGPNSGTTPLPTYLAYLNGRTNANDPAAYTGGSQTWTNTTLTGRHNAASPSATGAAGDLDGSSTFRGNAVAAGLAANFFIPNPDVDDVNVTDSGAFSDYHALQIDLRRRLSRGLALNVNYQYAIERGSAFDGFSFGRTMVDQGNVRHAIKTTWDWTIPVGRGQRFGTDLNPILDGIVGGWSLNGVGRVQARTINLGNVRLVGMSVGELTDLYRYEVRPNSAGIPTVFALPDDIILNTRRAFSTSSTTLDGYSTALGAPEGRYIAPANSKDCIQVRAGDCAPRTVIIRTPFFTRFDIGVTKKFPIKGTTNFEVRFDVLNLFDNINFDPVDLDDNPQGTATSAQLFQVTTAYRDPSNTYDPGGRIGQLMFRFNW